MDHGGIIITNCAVLSCDETLIEKRGLFPLFNITVRASFYRRHKREMTRIVKLKTRIGRRDGFIKTLLHRRSTIRSRTCTLASVCTYCARAHVCSDNLLLWMYLTFNVSYSGIYAKDEKIKHHPFRPCRVIKRSG